MPQNLSEQTRERRKAQMRDYHAARKAAGWVRVRTPEQAAHTSWWKRYRVRPPAVYGLWESQGRACGVCAVALPQPGTAKHVHIDHCHATGKVRGILCKQCNHLLGNAQDSVPVLQQAIAYLTRSTEC